MGSSARRVATTLVVTWLAITGCNNLFGSRQQAAPIPPERTTLRVGVGNPIDTAPLRIAVADGSFTRAGLNVELVEQQSQEEGLARLAAGDLDVAFASDVALFKAASGGTALQLQGEAYTAAAFTMALVTLPGSNYVDPMSKRAPKIAVDTPGDLGALTSRSVLVTEGVDPTKIKFVQRSFAQMPDALSKGEADAAWMVEPFITKAQKELGAQILTDTARGATLDFPMTGYASSGLFAQSNARTLTLFRQVLGAAQQRASDQATIREALPRVAGIDQATAALVALGTYPTSLNGVRLQRVADLMHSSGLLANRLDVLSLLPKTDTP